MHRKLVTFMILFTLTACSIFLEEAEKIPQELIADPNLLPDLEKVGTDIVMDIA